MEEVYAYKVKKKKILEMMLENEVRIKAMGWFVGDLQMGVVRLGEVRTPLMKTSQEMHSCSA